MTAYRDNLALVVQNAAMALLVPGAWCQDALARTAAGKRTTPTAPDACQWCAIGAVDAAAAHMGLPPTAKHEIIRRLGDIDEYNDAAENAEQVAKRLFNAAERIRHDNP